LDEDHRIAPTRPHVTLGAPEPVTLAGPARPIVLVATVRDESEIVEAWLSWSFAHGLDAAILQDNGSVDGTRALLDQLAQRWPILVIDEPCQDMNQSLWSTRLTWLAREALGADWVILSDADEFWLPPEASFAAAIAAATAPPFEAATILQIPQTMMLGDPATGFADTGRFSDATLGLVRPLPRIRHQFMLPHFNLNALMTPLPKVWVRASALPLVLPGNHTAFSRDALVVPAPMIDCLHVSYRSFGHWRRKLQRWVESFGRNTAPFDRDSAEAWRRVSAVIADETACRAFYQRTIFGTPYHQWLKAAGRIVERGEITRFLANPTLPTLAPLSAAEQARAHSLLPGLDQRLPRIVV
jgi:glycosyltransferase involved in cell wall biosynthesis